VSAGALHTCGVRGDGSAWCWGDNIYGQLGDLTTVFNRKTPTRVLVYPGPFGEVSSSQDGNCARQGSVTGPVVCWGVVPAGYHGDGVTIYAEVDADFNHACARRPAGTLWCWGSNTFGQIGDGTTVARGTPVQVGTGTDWVTAALGALTSCGIRGPGALYCWGNNDFGQLGDGTTTNRLVPTLLPALP